MNVIPLDFFGNAKSPGRRRFVIGDVVEYGGKKYKLTMVGLNWANAILADAKPDGGRKPTEYMLRVKDLALWVDKAEIVEVNAELDNLSDPTFAPTNVPIGDPEFRARIVRDLEERMKGMDLRPAQAGNGDEALRAKIQAELQAKMNQNKGQ